MEKKGSTKTKFTVIIGYVLVMAVMAFGLIALYNNLVDYSSKKINNQDLSELLAVSNTLSLLYEIESEQNLITPESAEQYFQRYDSIVPIINANLNELKKATIDTGRIMKLDSIELLVGMKKENLKEMAVLLDSLGRSPKVLRETESSYVPRELNREISGYIESRNLSGQGGTRSDTTVVAGERRRFIDRVRDVFDGRADSTVMIERRSVISDPEFRLIVDTIINKVRYSERLDLERQRRFQQALFERQELMGQTNRLLTGRIDDLLKEIEHEEMAKSVQLLVDKEEALARSENTMQTASLIALVIALVFGVLFLVDVNKSQRYRKQLEVSNRRVSDMLAARERLMLTISHDIKAPMSSILGYLELMNNKASNRHDAEAGGHEQSNGEARENQEYLENMQHSGKHVLQLVSTLLDYHKLESGAWQMKAENVNLWALIEETALSFKPLADRKGLEYLVNNQLPRALVCYLDPYVTRQVMSNLISNAIKYTPGGRVSITAREETKEGISLLIFKVADTGPGIDPEDQVIVFQDFKQLDGSPGQPGRPEGSGLGLAITKGFVEEMNGNIRVKSEKDSGSEFIVELPLQPQREAATRGDGEPAAREEDISLEDMKKIEGISVLVVDDDPVQLKMTARMLAMANVKVVTEEYPERVIKLLEKQPFHVLFIDLQMPGTDGFVLVKKIRQREAETRENLPVVALSARSDVMEEELQQAGFNGFLTKPFSSYQLYSTILQHVGGKGARPRQSSRAGKVKGLQALVDFVSEDKEASLGILHSFVQEATRHAATLEASFANNNPETAGKAAHTMLPLARMIGDELAVSRLERVEKRELLQPGEEQALLDWLKEQVKEARTRARKIEDSSRKMEKEGYNKATTR